MFVADAEMWQEEHPIKPNMVFVNTLKKKKIAGCVENINGEIVFWMKENEPNNKNSTGI